MWREQNDCLRIARKVHPDLTAYGFFTTSGNREFYFADLQEVQIIRHYRSFYENSDYAFTVSAVYSLCDERIGEKWKRMEGERFAFTFPHVVVKEWSHMCMSFIQFKEAMLKIPEVNAVIADNFEFSDIQTETAMTVMSDFGVTLIRRIEIEGANFLHAKQIFSNTSERAEFSSAAEGLHHRILL